MALSSGSVEVLIRELFTEIELSKNSWFLKFIELLLLYLQKWFKRIDLVVLLCSRLEITFSSAQKCLVLQ
jgi:hypothetical protein